MGVRVLCAKVSPFSLTWSILRISVTTPIFRWVGNRDNSCSSSVWMIFSLYTPKGTGQRAQHHSQLAGSSRQQQLSSIPWLWTSKGPSVGHKGYVDESFQISFYFVSFLFVSSLRETIATLLISLHMRVFLCSNYVCHCSLSPFYFFCYCLEQRWIEQQK